MGKPKTTWNIRTHDTYNKEKDKNHKKKTHTNIHNTNKTNGGEENRNTKTCET